ncbi:Dual specificity protein phosphatase 19 [Larimichthys crocea]|uniref:Dual specificity protein phosphatase 19 n=2 Tax=Larimichthys crocea TaxID=215358 RepID=A0A6G0J8F1_LARCR|nr:dual specificity protein phosphatase 19 [Larimichthys crocea]KAE8299874.1 Dual specificity protein phosphatase 19 [Larimichthys crocea]
MQSLTEEIQSFSRTRLRKQCTRVTSLSGRRIIETWKGSTITVVEDPTPTKRFLGYVPDTSWDLQVGTVMPYLLLGSQDAAHDFGTLRKHKISHILNVAFGVENVFPDLFIYKTVSILDQPDADVLLHMQDCCDFIQQAHSEKGVVLVHCNAGVSRAPAVVIGYLMSCDGQSFDDAFSLVKSARPASCPNPGFLEQLRNYKTQTMNGSKY